LVLEDKKEAIIYQNVQNQNFSNKYTLRKKKREKPDGLPIGVLSTLELRSERLRQIH